MVRTIFKDDKVGGVDRICGCKLAEIIMLNMRGHVDDYVPEFISLTMQVLTNEEPKVKSLKIHLMEVVINSIYYNPALALHVLETNGWTNKFFSLWFSSIDNFTRVHDKKLCISAICALLTLRAENVPVSVQQGWPRLLQGVVRLFQTLPAALKSKENHRDYIRTAYKSLDREEAKREDNYEFANEYEEEEDDEWEQEADWTAEADEAEGDVKDESAAYLEFLNEEVLFPPFRDQNHILMECRLRSSPRSTMTTMTSSKRKVSSKHHSTRSNHTACSSMRCLVRTATTWNSSTR
jgi:hypothetical protein